MLTLYCTTALVLHRPYCSVAAILSLSAFSYAQLTILPSFHSSNLQMTKIHRCWIVYGQNIRVIIVPSILALAYLGPSFYLDSFADLDLLPLVMWPASTGAEFIVQNQVDENAWGVSLGLTSLVTSMTVNALVTGLIVFKIFKIFREVNSVTTLEDKSLGITHGNKLRSVTFIIIESGMALFAIQLARVVISTTAVSALESKVSATHYAFELIVSIHEMVNVIIHSHPYFTFTDNVHLTRV